MKTTYAIFEVYDYKGGELSSSTNLTRKQVAESLAEEYDSWKFEEFPSITKDTTRDEIAAFIKANPIEPELYAGGEGFVAEIYKVTNSRMTALDVSDFTEDIINYIDNNWRP